MAKIFVSHASADSHYVNEFVDSVLRIGCGLKNDGLFYTSAADTGVPSGQDLMATVRREVQEATIVVAIITPMYQVRPVCIAELGAAWGRSGVLFPMLSVGLDRRGIEGVVPSMLTQYLDDSGALDELFDRIKGTLTPQPATTTWGVGKQKWLTYLASDRVRLSVPDVPTAEQYDSLKRSVAELREALVFTEQEVKDLKEQNQALANAKDAEEVREIRVPKEAVARFKQYREAATTALAALPRVMADGIFLQLRGEMLSYPNRFNDPDRADAIDDAIQRSLLDEYDNGCYFPNANKGKVRDAIEAVKALEAELDPSEPEFATWFESTYGTEPDLRDRDCWEAVLG